jgi:ABC-type polysaccharide/polyol phosphate transport system ATPase subunit
VLHCTFIESWPLTLVRHCDLLTVNTLRPKSTVVKIENGEKAYSGERSRFALSMLFPVFFSSIKQSSHQVISKINLEIQSGEIVGICGRNGSGKSTLLKLITGVLAISRGSIKVNGRIAAILELGFGFNPELSGRGNIDFLGSVLGIDPHKLHMKREEIIDFADIGAYIDKPVRMYSTGMKSRLAFAVATSVEPDILVVDEVLAVGDAYFQKKCHEKMRDLLGHGRTVLIVSHDMNVLRRLCTRAILIESGAIVADGAPRDVTRLYEEVASISPKQRRALGDELEKIGNGVILKKSFHGARQFGIENVRLLTARLFSEGEKVDRLSLPFNADCEFRAEFKVDHHFSNASIGVAIKNHRGEALCGEIFGEISGNYNAVMDISWKFRSMLLPGVYFFTVDVRDKNRSESLCCVEDVLSFKIAKSDDGAYVGLFHANSNGAISMKSQQEIPLPGSGK